MNRFQTLATKTLFQKQSEGVARFDFAFCRSGSMFWISVKQTYNNQQTSMYFKLDLFDKVLGWLNETMRKNDVT